MVLFGKVSSIEVDNTKFKVTFPDKENVVSPVISKAPHVGELTVGSNVIVACRPGDLSGGVIIATY